ncbi:Nitrogen permease regulator 2 [Neocucurbitaria cava]|uniref:Nitrogen permease regulator 2 n=1 Tax=Neocucurbitaria cava TaxID=798079 RepID=A0A9W8Y3H6_9PLEO|nr:Nitrogen permease regulator 2 [Neocucurbitaria cava]
MPTRAIKAIFYTRFHHEKGNRVLHQVPSGSITPSTLPSALPAPLFPFASVTQYLIPTQQFCDRLLTFCVNHHRVIGYPVCIREGKYSRNEFIFNFAVVIGENELDWACYGEVVRKLGGLLRGLEEQGGFLSREEEGVWEEDDNGAPRKDNEGLGTFGVGAGSKVYALCEMVLEDLNNYAECMIPIDDSNTINLKLFPTRPPPPPILAHHVPLLTISLASLQSPISSDLTLNRILPYIDGVNSISHIAQLADTDLSLTRRAIQHLVYYGCLVLLDIFSFGAIYAPTAEIGGFVVDADVKEECTRYVRVPRLRLGSNAKTIRVGSESEKSRDERASVSSTTSQHSDTAGSAMKASEFDSHIASQKNDNEDENEWHIDHETLITLYTSLRQGLTLKNWVLENLDLLSGIDVRRFITFGIIKGFLYRLHKYSIATSTVLPPAPPTSLQTSAATSIVNPSRDSDTETIRGANKHHHHSSNPSSHLSSHATTPSQAQAQHTNPSFSLYRPHSTAPTSLNPHLASSQLLNPPKTDDLQGLGSFVSSKERDGGLPLLKFLDGMHCFDEICTELGLPEKIVEGKIRGMGRAWVLLFIVNHKEEMGA